jgi:transcriptional regulator with XRE-family HTH domain
MSTFTKEQEAALRARFAHNLRIHRVQKSLSQEELAALSKVHRTFISDVEREIRNISIDNIGKLAHALGIDAMEFFRPIREKDEGLPKSLPKGPRNRKTVV